MQKTKKVGRSHERKFFHPDSVAALLQESVIFDLAGMCESEIPHISLFAKTQTKDFLSKYDPFENPNLELLKQECINKFLSVNKHLGEKASPIEIPLVSSVSQRRNFSVRELVLLRAKAFISALLMDFSFDEWYSYCKHGPGSTVGVPFMDTSTDAKWTFPLTVTAEAIRYFHDYLQFNPFMANAIYEKNYIYFPFLKLSNSIECFGLDLKIVEGSKATTVPKTSSKRRFIAVEPTVNMFLQQGLGILLMKRLAEFGLNLSIQEQKHKILAKEASVDRKKVTVDFSSASDCVSVHTIEYLFPPKWKRVLLSLASKTIEVNKLSVCPNMFASMGNATTFPVETIVFWALGIACLYTTDHPSDMSLLVDIQSKSEVDVFGDDCILPERAYPLFKEITESIGFIINVDKTFVGDNPFRESCGADYYDGNDVRPVHLRAPVNNNASSLESWLYVILNRIQSKYTTYLGTEGYLKSKFLREVLMMFKSNGFEFKFVPEGYPDDSGYATIEHLTAILSLSKEIGFKVSPIYYERPPKSLEDCFFQSYVFYYRRFQRPPKLRNFDPFLYLNALRTGYLNSRESETAVFLELTERFTSKRRGLKDRGGYIVAKGLTSKWTLPTFRDLIKILRRWVG